MKESTSDRDAGMRRRPLGRLLSIAMLLLLILGLLTACAGFGDKAYNAYRAKRNKAYRKWKNKDYSSFLTKKAELMADLAKSEAEHSMSDLFQMTEGNRIIIEAERARLQNQIDAMNRAENESQEEEPENTDSHGEVEWEDTEEQWWGSDEWKKNPDAPPPGWSQ